MPENSQRESFVVVHATDLRPDAGTTLDHGVAIARRGGGRLVTLHVSEKLSAESMSDPEHVVASAALQDLDVPHHEVVCRIGEKPKKGLVNSLRDNDADLLIVGTRQQVNQPKGFRGSVSEVAALDAPVPTLVVHIGQQGLVDDADNFELRRILLPVGDGEEGRDAIRGTTEFLDRLDIDDVDIFLLRVGGGDILEHLTIPEREGWRWHRETRQGFVSNVIGEVCEEKDIDLIAMATRGQDGVIDVFSGTHTQKVIRRVPRPLLVIPMK